MGAHTASKSMAGASPSERVQALMGNVPEHVWEGDGPNPYHDRQSCGLDEYHWGPCLHLGL